MLVNELWSNRGLDPITGNERNLAQLVTPSINSGMYRTVNQWLLLRNGGKRQVLTYRRNGKVKTIRKGTYSNKSFSTKLLKLALKEWKLDNYSADRVPHVMGIFHTERFLQNECKWIDD